MGFSGELVFGRSERPLLEAPVFGGAQEDDRGGITAWWPRPGGWQTLQFHDTLPADTDEVLRAVVEWTGAPACVARVHDSDVALVSGLEPGGDRWQTWLNLVIAAEMTDRPQAELDARVPGDAARILAWAWDADAGEGVESAAIAQTLRSREPCVEDLFSTLLDRLGFPPPTEPEARG
ncbi:hypothetical protein AB0892_14030 [Streptomyces sp. NPDC005409]|uniref:hypothetical protein n=1 Tax=Streptomyces sp. NPDC005409 TaxID=3155342 RepID=UPI0034518C6D